MTVTTRPARTHPADHRSRPGRARHAAVHISHALTVDQRRSHKAGLTHLTGRNAEWAPTLDVPPEGQSPGTHSDAPPQDSAGLAARVDAGGICQWVSPLAGTEMGWTTAWTLGRSLSDLVHPDHHMKAPSGFALDQWDLHTRHPTPYRAADGVYHWMTVSVSPKRGTPGYKRDGLLIRFNPSRPAPTGISTRGPQAGAPWPTPCSCRCHSETTTDQGASTLTSTRRPDGGGRGEHRAQDGDIHQGGRPG